MNMCVSALHNIITRFNLFSHHEAASMLKHESSDPYSHIPTHSSKKSFLPHKKIHNMHSAHIFRHVIKTVKTLILLLKLPMKTRLYEPPSFPYRNNQNKNSNNDNKTKLKRKKMKLKPLNRMALSINFQMGH